MIIEKTEYEECIRILERARILREFVEANRYISEKELRMILAMPERKEEEKHDTV